MKMKRPKYAVMHAYLVCSKKATSKDVRGIARELIKLRLAEKTEQYPLALNILDCLARLLCFRRPKKRSAI